MLALRSIEGLIAGRAVPQRYRNRRLGDFLKEIKLTEGRLTGIQMIQTAMHQNGSPDPLFETDEDRTWFSVVLRPHPAFEEAATPAEELESTIASPMLVSLLGKALKASNQADDQATNQVTNQATNQDDHHDDHHDVHDDVHDDVVEQMIQVILFCKDGDRTREELLAQIGKKRYTQTVRRYLYPLERIGWLEKTLPDKPQSRKQKYRLGKAARDALSQDERQP